MQHIIRINHECESGIEKSARERPLASRGLRSDDKR